MLFSASSQAIAGDLRPLGVEPSGGRASQLPPVQTQLVVSRLVRLLPPNNTTSFVAASKTIAAPSRALGDVEGDAWTHELPVDAIDNSHVSAKSVPALLAPPNITILFAL